MRPASPALGLPASSVRVTGRITPRLWADTIRPGTEPTAPETQQAVTTRPMSTAVRVVSLLAFGQAVVFLALWLLVCASAGAAPDSTKNFEPALQLSTYAPTGVRDPIARVGASEVKVVPGLNFPFVLEGILYQPSNPSAVINGTLVTLNKTVTLTAGSAEIQVRAIQIDRDRVVLEAGTRKVDLHLNNGTPPSAP